ncbi:similar to Saccharomyces cerevisiae YDR138W HPR1 Subunit of THO/TREX complexes that couple transcription elongation with mitotic recombination and with mRNA metabolism and export [Maudiozyma saulgeensis]|uniref:Similar to Saccharomyces cerevisiae YDR138W HPR1 Subunit of THO/TREX complexes that couple transcription elongation with mitotic recombination and with mRNA metabolism and export n=1 Tax=Maudiozyma saulgeensis TaxID=1789683 RepID=A0A1X7R778_9SACH|nr:similar to Saccharomyces cerevisiae YDR138W HPR1 Subunit of THO/TREX complexes that couple transcription elongation with mitotic recombination and with mRNA metabolism and export [Kazachstania saulgeensis]
MSALDSAIQECVNYLLPIFLDISKSTESILNEPSSATLFNEIVDLKWQPLEKLNMSDDNLDMVVNITLNRIISDTLMAVGEIDNQETALTSIEKAQLCATVLDFIFHSRKSRKTVENWKVSFFKLFSEVIDILSWPTNIAEFFSYPESRIDWFKLNPTVEQEYSGISSLISYKNPLSEHLRHWNEMLSTLEKNTTFNTPAHYKMKFRLEKFISNLLPIYEESNFNRSAQISQKQDSSNPWNRTKTNTRPTTSPEILTEDYLYLYNKVLTNPISFTFNTFQMKRDAERAVGVLLDAILDAEDTFYKQARYKHKNISLINEKLNPNYQADFTIMPESEPSYLKDSSTFQTTEKELWSSIVQFYEKNEHIPRPTALAFATKNPTVLYDQLLKTNNDVYRKQFILQILFVSQLLEKLIESEDIRKFYKMNREKEGGNGIIDIGKLEDSNLRKLASIYTHVCKNRIAGFYQTRDATFTMIFKRLLEDNDNYMLEKTNNFKYFQNFKVPEQNKKMEIDTNFKKFGFIKLGNKQIDNAWKIRTGLDCIVDQSRNPDDIFKDLKEEYENQNIANENVNDEIVHQWQILRSVRSRYLSEFGKYNETNGVSGIFKEQNSGDTESRRVALRLKFASLAKKSHDDQLLKARQYMEEKASLKRKREEETEELQKKKAELNIVDPSTTMIVVNETNENDSNVIENEEKTQNPVQD